MYGTARARLPFTICAFQPMTSAGKGSARAAWSWSVVLVMMGSRKGKLIIPSRGAAGRSVAQIASGVLLRGSLALELGQHRRVDLIVDWRRRGGRRRALLDHLQQQQLQ